MWRFGRTTVNYERDYEMKFSSKIMIIFMLVSILFLAISCLGPEEPCHYCNGSGDCGGCGGNGELAGGLTCGLCGGDGVCAWCDGSGEAN